jgi:hypothetical protein
LEVIAMKLISKALILGLAMAGASIVACSTDTKGTSGSSLPSDARTGRIGMQFTLPTGATISTVNWTISGPTSTSGTVTAGQTSIEFVVGGLTAGAYNGAGQGITLTATDSQGDHCSSPQTGFTITAGATTQLIVQMTCFQNDGGVLSPTTGSLEVDAGVSVVAVPTCPIITSFSVSPAEEPVGSTSMISVLTNPPGSTVVCTSSNTLVAPNPPAGAMTTLTCASAGQTQLTCSTTVTLPDGGMCPPNSMSALINCEPSDVTPTCPTMGQTFCPGVGCTNLQTDNNNCGACGTVCTGSNVCTAGVCTACSGVQSACNALKATINVAGHTPPTTTCNATELAIFQKIPTGGSQGACMSCAYTNGVLDLTGVTTNAECEDLGATGDGGTAAGLSQCLTTLECDTGLTPGSTDSCGGQLYSSMADPMGTLLINAFCGAGVSSTTCQTGGAMGACRTQWRAGFQGQPDSFIVGQNSNQAYPSGMANNLSGGLLNNCASSCFP